MPPKQRITREMILERSFEMFCREGMEAVNARSVAKAMNCSTQPIFSYFSGMQDLKNQLEEKAGEQFQAALHVQREGDPLIGIGCAYTRFAVEQPKLFAHLFMMKQDGLLYPFAGEARRQELVEREAAYLGLTQEQADVLYTQMSIYIHGLAAVCAVQRADFAPEDMERMIVSHQAMLLKGIRA